MFRHLLCDLMNIVNTTLYFDQFYRPAASYMPVGLSKTLHSVYQHSNVANQQASTNMLSGMTWVVGDMENRGSEVSVPLLIKSHDSYRSLNGGS